VVVADIGLDVSRATAGVVEAHDVAGWVPVRRADSHKWKAATLVVAGSPGMTGAAHLTAAAAQRSGAGMVRLGTPGIADDDNRPTESVGLALPAEGWATRVAEASSRYGAVVVGPGLGREPAAAEGVHSLVALLDTSLVIDGDGLAALGGDVVERLRGRTGPTILTPHDGELRQLTGEAPAPDRFGAARELAAQTHAVVLLKGPSTVVAEPDGRVAVVVGDPRLATAGTGDVLSGVIGALLARGTGPFEAAAAGAWLHARAAALAPPGVLVAGDLPPLVGRALAEIDR
jgi:NAD(P)H-hydrate epimerase